MQTGTYGSKIAALFQLPDPPCLTVGRAGEVKIAVTRLRSDTGLQAPSAPPVREAAYSIHLHMRDSAEHALWLRGQPVFTGGYRAGATSLVNLDDEPNAWIGTPFDFLQVYVPYGSLDDVAAEHGAQPIGELVWPRGAEDPAAARLAALLLAGLGPEGGNALFVEHIMLALRIHIAQTYGGMAAQSRRAGGLAPWQERRAKELMQERLSGSFSISDLARECGLSPSHFTHAFRQSTGTQPHRWLSQLRIAAAKRLLLAGELRLAEIAVACGFADQSHFTRVFSREVGVSPGAWQRDRRG